MIPPKPAALLFFTLLMAFTANLRAQNQSYISEDLEKEGTVVAYKRNFDDKFSVRGGTISGSGYFGQDLGVAGQVTLAGPTSISGAITVSTAMAVSGPSNFTGALTTSSFTALGAATMTGRLNLQSSSNTATGYTYLPNGFILQWGEYTASMAHASSYSPAFSLTFPTAVLQVVAYVTNTVATGTTATYCPLTASSTSGFTFQYGAINGGTYTTTVRYFAVGY